MIELKKRIICLIFCVIAFRVGSFIPLPGINVVVLSKMLNTYSGNLFDMFNMFSGGSLSRASIFSLGITPYISSSIIMQLLTLINPFFLKIKKEGESGSRKISKYTRYLTFILSIIQSIGLATSVPYLFGMKNLFVNVNSYFYIVAILSLTSGSLFLMWLSEVITEYGLGNGTSVIIFVSIVSSFPIAIRKTLYQFKQYSVSSLEIVSVVIIILISIVFVVFIERCQRKILVRYARRERRYSMYSAQNTHLPLKLNISGVMPAIFSSSIMILPTTIMSWYVNHDHRNLNFFYEMLIFLQKNKIFYIFFYSSSIIFFCFFYSGLVLNPRDTARNLKKSGAFIPGIRPGEKTESYIRNIMLKLTCIGSLYMTLICLLPEFFKHILNMPFYFGGTSLLIVVVVIIEFVDQVNTLIISNQYDTILKKSNLYFNSKKK